MSTAIEIEEEITAVAISQDGNFIASASFNESDEKVSLWCHSINPGTTTTLDDNVLEGYLEIDLKTMFSQKKFDGKFDLTISKNLTNRRIQTPFLLQLNPLTPLIYSLINI